MREQLATKLEETAQSIDTAFEELTPHAFGLWIRLHLVPEGRLAGRVRLAALVGLSKNAFNNRLRELKLKGYIRLHGAVGSGARTRVELLRRALIVAPNHFVRLG